MKDKSYGQKDAPLLEALLAYSQKRMIPFHTPGHRGGRGSEPLWRKVGKKLLPLDLTELKEIAPGRDSESLVRAAEELAAEAFGARRTYFLVNGASGGIISALLAVGTGGKKIIVARNCHLSVINGLLLSGLSPVFVSPRWIAGLPALPAPAAVKEALRRHPEAAAILVTNPGYHGIYGPLAEIGAVAKAAGLPLLVDEAHGGHLRYLGLAVEAAAAGADLWIWGVHKIMGSLTQTGMLHLGSGKIDPGRVEQALALTGTTSPSYLLLASLDSVRRRLYFHGREMFARAAALGEKIRKKLRQTTGLEVLEEEQLPEGYGLDPTKIVLSFGPSGLPGLAAAEILRRKYRIQPEYADLHNLYFFLAPAQRTGEVRALLRACRALAGTGGYEREKAEPPPWSCATPVFSPREAWQKPSLPVPLGEAAGKIAAGWVAAYPPGIPLWLPGERITKEMTEWISRFQQAGGYVRGVENNNIVRVVNDS